jgi:glycosyltransferase 2 family protein
MNTTPSFPSSFPPDLRAGEAVRVESDMNSLSGASIAGETDRSGALEEGEFGTGPLVAEPDIHPPKRRWGWVGTVASLILLAISVFVLWRISNQIEKEHVMSAFSAASREQITFSIGLTTLSYLFLTCYDALALRQLRLKVSYATTALASFTSYAVSFNLGFPLITGGTVRYWIYAPKGVSAAQVASLSVIAGITFWLGMGVVLGWGLLKEASAVADLTNLKVSLTRLLGGVSLGLVASYFVWVGLKRRIVSIQGWRLELPGFRLSVAQALLGIGDVCAAAGVLFLLLPAGNGLNFETFLAIYIAAVMLGIASHSPGGLGVFEATILLALDHLPKGQVLGALLLYRLIYFVLPFVLALACLGGYEIKNRMKILGSIFKRGNHISSKGQ